MALAAPLLVQEAAEAGAVSVHVEQASIPDPVNIYEQHTTRLSSPVECAGVADVHVEQASITDLFNLYEQHPSLLSSPVERAGVAQSVAQMASPVHGADDLEASLQEVEQLYSPSMIEGLPLLPSW